MREQLVSLFTLRIYWLSSNLCTETLQWIKLSMNANKVYQFSSSLHGWCSLLNSADTIPDSSLLLTPSFSSPVQEEWLISLMPLYNAPQVKHRNICETIVDVKRKTEKVESVRSIWYQSLMGPRFSMRNSLANVRSPSTRGANHLRNQITVAICSWGIFLLRLKKNLHMGAALHQTCCDTTGANLPILFPTSSFTSAQPSRTPVNV